MERKTLSTLLTLLFFINLNLSSQEKKYSFGIEPVFSVLKLSKDNAKYIDSQDSKAYGLGLIAERRISSKLSINSGLYYITKKTKYESSLALTISDGYDTHNTTLGITTSNKSNYIRIPLKLNYYHKNLFFSGGILFDYNTKNKLLDYSITENQIVNLDIGKPMTIEANQLYYALEFNAGYEFSIFNDLRLIPNATFNMYFNNDDSNFYEDAGAINSYGLGIGLKLLY